MFDHHCTALHSDRSASQSTAQGSRLRIVLAIGLMAALAAAGCARSPSTTEVGSGAGAETDRSSSVAPAAPAQGIDTRSAGGYGPRQATPGAEFQDRGPFEVGITTLVTPAGTEVEVLYPATDAAEGMVDSYRVRSFLPPAIAAIIPEDIPDSFQIAAGRDTPAANDGPFPVVLFSHGFSAFRLQSSELMSHLASWGMVVAAPDHASRNLIGQLGGGSESASPALTDLRDTRTLVELAGVGPGLLRGVVDSERVALAGHSAGGGTVLEMADDPGIDGFISYASGARPGVALPNLPSLFMAGDLDEVVEPERTVEAFDRTTSTSWLWRIEDAGHLAFSDLCVIGDGQGGLIGLAEAAGIGALVPESLRRLATDGCNPPNLAVPQVWPAVHQASVGFLRTVFSTDAQPTGLDAFASDGVTVSIARR